MTLFVHHDGLHVGRSQRTNHELRWVFRPQHDVHTLTRQLVGHAVDARTTHAHTGANRINAFVVRLHRNLGARTGVAGAGFDFKQTLFDLGHFLRKQLDHETGRAARQQNLRPAKCGINFGNVGPHAVTRTQVFFRNHFAAAQAAFNAALLDDHVAFVQALDGADEDFFAARQEVGQQLFALGIANFLQNHLLGGLRTNAANGHRIDRLFDVVIYLDVRDLLQRFKVKDFRVRQLQTRRVGHHVPTAEGFVFTSVAVHRHPHVHFAALQLFRSRSQSRLHGSEHDFAFHVFFT